MGQGCPLAFQGLDSEAGQSSGRLGKTCPGPNQGAVGRCPGEGLPACALAAMCQAGAESHSPPVLFSAWVWAAWAGQWSP